jgi:hypothetical protein
MMAFGAAAPKRSGGNNAGGWGRPIESPMRWLPLIFTSAEIAAAEAYAPQPRDTWLPETQVMIARDEAKTGRGWYVAAKGGHNNESHNHNDIGEFVVYRNGLPLLIDAGVETYSRKTFSPQRYEIWTMQSAYHNLPTIDGVQQQPGEQFAARDVVYDAENTMLTLDIAGAYPPEAGVARWTRTVRLKRGEGVEVVDDYELNHTPRELAMSLLTPCTVALDEAGVIRLSAANLPDGRKAGSGVIRYDAARFVASVESIPITDTRMKPVWGGQLYRVLLNVVNPAQNDPWTLKIEA